MRNTIVGLAICIMTFALDAAAQNTFPASGSVGIGTTSPQAILDVASGHSGQTGPVVGIQIDGPNSPANANSAQDIRFGINAAGSAHIRSYRGGSWDTYLQFLTNGVNQGSDSPQVRLTIDQGGNVGIGTTNPGASLEVNGNVKLTSGSGASVTFQDGSIQSTAYTGSHGVRWRLCRGRGRNREPHPI